MVNRCQWATGYPATDAMVLYHDQEFGQPVRNDDRKLFELLSLELFQAGLSWRTVLNKRENFRLAFANFDLQNVAQFDEEDVTRLMANHGIIRNRMKIEATINNAQQILRLQEKSQSFSAIVWQLKTSFTGQGSQDSGAWDYSQLAEQFSRQLKKLGFRFVGPVTMRSFLQAVGVVNGHESDCDFS